MGNYAGRGVSADWRKAMVRLKTFLPCFATAVAVMVLCGCKAESKYRGLGPVRVRIVSGKSTCNVSSSGPVIVRNFKRRRRVFRGKLGGTVTFKRSSRGIIAGRKLYKVDGLFIEAGSGSALVVNGNAYRGDISIHREGDSLVVVNYVDIEDYVKGVMTNEMIASWDEEALKAQAVVARSFAMYHILKYPDRVYNIESNKIQYKGKDTEDPRTNKAVDRTKGEVVFFNGSLLLPHFCSSCGGHTEYAGNVWEAWFRFPEPVPCPYCEKTNEHDWEKKLGKKQMALKLRQAGVDVDKVKSVIPDRKSAFGGRITQFAVKTGGKTRRVRINKLRFALGTDVIKSGMLTVQNGKDEILFRGKGWGHGVGMCQFGAKSMADLGYSYEAILKYYYPDSRLKRVKY